MGNAILTRNNRVTSLQQKVPVETRIETFHSLSSLLLPPPLPS